MSHFSIVISNAKVQLNMFADAKDSDKNNVSILENRCEYIFVTLNFDPYTFTDYSITIIYRHGKVVLE